MLAATNALYLAAIEVGSLTGEGAVAQAVKDIKALLQKKSSSLKPTTVTFHASLLGITMVDLDKKFSILACFLISIAIFFNCLLRHRLLSFRCRASEVHTFCTGILILPILIHNRAFTKKTIPSQAIVFCKYELISKKYKIILLF